MRRTTILVTLLLLALSASAADSTEVLLAKAWPAAVPSGVEETIAGMEELGTGIGIVFTPDLSVKNNCRFFEALGFACFESSDWQEILSGIHAYNIDHPGRRIRTLILETHGTNGNGLKVQNGKEPEDDRSYISVAALQEMVEPAGVRYVIISACNSGRLLRPEIYRKLNPNNGDKLFLPATRGILDATDTFDPKRTIVTVITPATSHIETTLVGSLRELAPETRTALEAVATKRNLELPKQFAVSEMLIQMLLRDPQLQLRTGAHVEELSKVQTSPETSERIFKAFVDHLGTLATCSTTTASNAVAAR